MKNSFIRLSGLLMLLLCLALPERMMAEKTVYFDTGSTDYTQETVTLS